MASGVSGGWLLATILMVGARAWVKALSVRVVDRVAGFGKPVSNLRHSGLPTQPKLGTGVLWPTVRLDGGCDNEASWFV